MVYKVHKPSEALSKYISEMVYIKDHHPDHTMEKYLPDGTINIVFELAGIPKFIFDNITKEQKQKCTDVWFSGVLKDYITISSSAEEMMVVVFKPGVGYSLIQNPIDTYSNKVTPAQDVFGDSILKLHSKLKQPLAPEEKFANIEKWLLEQYHEDDQYTNIIQFAIDAIQNSPSNITIAALTKKLGYSQKQFIQLFKKYVGITPKQFHRITRFNEILAAVDNKEKLSWTSIAGDCGYFDQAHFIRDFQSFSGLNPKQYLYDIGDYPNYVPVR